MSSSSRRTFGRHAGIGCALIGSPINAGCTTELGSCADMMRVEPMFAMKMPPVVGLITAGFTNAQYTACRSSPATVVFHNTWAASTPVMFMENERTMGGNTGAEDGVTELLGVLDGDSVELGVPGGVAVLLGVFEAETEDVAVVDGEMEPLGVPAGVTDPDGVPAGDTVVDAEIEDDTEGAPLIDPAGVDDLVG